MTYDHNHSLKSLVSCMKHIHGFNGVFATRNYKISKANFSSKIPRKETNNSVVAKFKKRAPLMGQRNSLRIVMA